LLEDLQLTIKKVKKEVKEEFRQKEDPIGMTS